MDFAQVEAEFGELKAQFEQGGLTEEELKAQLQELMIEDEQGRWWIIGYETGQWYVHDGEQWVKQEPPKAAPSPPPARPQYPGAAELAPGLQPGPSTAAPSRPALGLKLGRDTVSVLLITAGWLVFWGATGLLRPVEFYRGLPSLTILAIAGLVGGLITGLVLRRTDPPSPWKQVPVVALGWALGWGIAGVSPGYGPPILGIVGPFVGGFITALALKWTHPSIQWKHVALVTLGWGLGWAVGGAISGILVQGYAGVITILRYGLWAAIGAGAGSWVMFWQLREARQGPS